MKSSGRTRGKESVRKTYPRPDTTAGNAGASWRTWALLLVWLGYSAAALGWHLTTDPSLSNAICRSR